MPDHQKKWKASLSGIAVVLIAVALVGFFLIYIYFNMGKNPRLFISDVHETALVPEYAGSFSNAAVIVLWSSAVVAAVAAMFGRFASQIRRTFVASIAVVNGFLALDDFFMGHEYAGLLIARALNSENEGEDRQLYEAFVFAVFILLGIAWLWWMRHQILSSLYPLLLLGIGGFAASIAVDLFPSIYEDFNNYEMRVITVVAVVEDLLKYVGVGGFAAYAWKSATPHLAQTSVESTL